MGSAPFVAAAVGIVIAMQVSIVGRASQRLDVLVVSMALQATGLAAGIAWTSVRAGWADFVGVAGSWWWVPLGVAGWVLVGALGFASARIGVASTLAIAIAGQLLAGLGLDAAAGSRVTLPAAAGVVLVVAGAVLVSMRP